MPAYDDSNIFARILRGEIPCYKVHEDDHVLAFMDVMPQADGHVLVVPKAPRAKPARCRSGNFRPCFGDRPKTWRSGNVSLPCRRLPCWRNSTKRQPVKPCFIFISTSSRPMKACPCVATPARWKIRQSWLQMLKS